MISLRRLLAGAVLLASVSRTGADAAHAANSTDTSVPTFAGNAQHTAVYSATAQDLNAIHWSTVIDLNPSGAFAHYGSPLLTSSNTIVVPVKTASDGFELKVLNAVDGSAKYSLATDYVLPSHGWIPVYQPALAKSSLGTRLYYPGAGGTIYSIDAPDSLSHGAPVRQVFYTTLADYQANAAGFNSTVFINTPLTPDGNGNIFFGFRVQGTAPVPLSTAESGFARIDPSGNATYVLAGTAAGDVNISHDTHNSAPALSNDQTTLYVVVKSASTDSYAYLLGLDATTLATKFSVFLKDPRNHNANNARLLDDSTASPMVAPDDDVYFGIYADNTGSRGFLLRFSGDLAVEKVPGGFGWDNTPAIVPAAMAPLYTGPSPYLIFTKYNDYANAGAGSGSGVNRIALLDPNATEVDPHPASNGMLIEREVQTVIGPTADAEERSAGLPYAVREWCINTAAVNPATQSVFTPSEDGHLYRWNLASNSLSQFVPLTAGIGEPYVPTVLGPDGTVFTLNGGTLFALGSASGAGITLRSSSPDVRDGVSGPSLTFTTTVTNAGGPGTLGTLPIGTVTFEDTVYFVSSHDVLGSTTTVLAADVPLDGAGQAGFTSSALSADRHFITALYSGDAQGRAGSAALVQSIHPSASATALAGAPNPSDPGQPVTFTASVTALPPGLATPTGMVTFAEGTTVLAQVPLDGSGAAAFTTSGLAAGNHSIAAVYASDTLFAASRGSAVQVVPGPITTVTLTSITAEDGWVREWSETSNTGGWIATAAVSTDGLRVGDDSSRRQYKTIVSFDTSVLPAGAKILSATLRLRRATLSGINPFTTHGTCWVDVQSGSGFAGSTALQSSDFQAPATAIRAASLTNAANDLDWSEGSLNAAGLSALNRAGTIQLRVYFNLAANNDKSADYIAYDAYDSGASGTSASGPELVVTYR
jgi:hypothetical protein